MLSKFFATKIQYVCLHHEYSYGLKFKLIVANTEQAKVTLFMDTL